MSSTNGCVRSVLIDLVLGQTDSERVFALITASIRARDGDVTAGLVDAMQWLAANVPIYAVNVLLRHRHRHVGAALPGVPSAVPAGPVRRFRQIRSAIRLAHQANSRDVGAAVQSRVGGVRHRADG